MKNIIAEKKDVVFKALQLYDTNSIDFVDCLLCAYYTESGEEILTFDKKLIKLIKKES